MLPSRALAVRSPAATWKALAPEEKAKCWPPESLTIVALTPAFPKAVEAAEAPLLPAPLIAALIAVTSVLVSVTPERLTATLILPASE